MNQMLKVIPAQLLHKALPNPSPPHPYPRHHNIFLGGRLEKPRDIFDSELGGEWNVDMVPNGKRPGML